MIVVAAWNKEDKPSMIAPAALNRFITPASLGTIDLSSEKDPAVVFNPMNMRIRTKLIV